MCSIKNGHRDMANKLLPESKDIEKDENKKGVQSTPFKSDQVKLLDKFFSY
jgi:hypothetical protein